MNTCPRMQRVVAIRLLGDKFRDVGVKRFSQESIMRLKLVGEVWAVSMIRAYEKGGSCFLSKVATTCSAFLPLVGFGEAVSCTCMRLEALRPKLSEDG